MVNHITQITVSGEKDTYTFELYAGEEKIYATCIQPNGGLNTAATWMELPAMLDDCVRTWETK